ncbi:MAG: 4-hydroxy-tetrahydrodipicolinate reductase [Clostridia bacterium]|nr:4-hydroxy-tetrahydrodipicolinate reductase [Clostridia bacterium]
MIRIILCGANGKMGHTVSRLTQERGDCQVVAGVDLNTASSQGFPVYPEIAQVKEEADVIIDFSHPSLLSSVLSYAKEKQTPIVICTTGLSDLQKGEIKKASADVAVFFSANMSLGINLLINLAQKTAATLEEEFDIEIVERHHNQKVDAPSGTALAIADAVNEAIENKKEYIYDRHSVRRKRGRNELGIHAVRGGTIVGDHTVIFAGTDEIIEIKHSATSREVFAVGAVRAALFIAHLGAGFYNMRDLIESGE